MIGSRKPDEAKLWSEFWQEQGPNARCANYVAPDFWRILSSHWHQFANSMRLNDCVIDLGCGSGAVGSAMLESNPNIQVVGIDYANIQVNFETPLKIISNTRLENLPFDDSSISGAVSQFGYEYGDHLLASIELSRVLRPRGRFSFVVHHSESLIVSTARSRFEAFNGLISPELRKAFVLARVDDYENIAARISLKYPHDGAVIEVFRMLRPHFKRSVSQRKATWTALDESLSLERSLLKLLLQKCVSPAEINEWTDPLGAKFDLTNVSEMRRSSGVPLGWLVEGVRR